MPAKVKRAYVSELYSVRAARVFGVRLCYRVVGGKRKARLPLNKQPVVIGVGLRFRVGIGIGVGIRLGIRVGIGVFAGFISRFFGAAYVRRGLIRPACRKGKAAAAAYQCGEQANKRCSEFFHGISLHKIFTKFVAFVVV